MKTEHWFLLIAVVALIYLFTRGDEDTYQSGQLNYDSFAISDGLTADAIALNLEDDLDVSLLPALGRDVIREAASQGLKEQAFLDHVLRGVSNRVREISTIDLNEDGQVDPVLVKPEPSESEGYVVLSLQVPHAKAYPLPQASDRAAWSNVETFEVATMSITLNTEALTVQAEGNKHTHPNQQGRHYSAYDTGGSFMQMYFAMRMMDWMFMPSYYGGWMGPGYGYGYHRPMGVGANMANRAGTIGQRGYNAATYSNTSAIRGRSTGAPPSSAYSRAYSSTPPKSMGDLRGSRRFVKRSPATAPGSRYANNRSAPRGFGRSNQRSTFRGGGIRFGK